MKTSAPNRKRKVILPNSVSPRGLHLHEDGRFLQKHVAGLPPMKKSLLLSLVNDDALFYVRLRYMRDISSGHKLPRGPDWSSEHATHMIDANNKYKLVTVLM